MTRADITEIILKSYPNWDIDSKEFYTDFLSELPNIKSLISFKLGINLDSQFTDENNSNISILQFENPIENNGTQQIYDYLNQYMGEDIIDYKVYTNIIIIHFQY